MGKICYSSQLMSQKHFLSYKSKCLQREISYFFMGLAAVCLEPQSYQWPEIKHVVNMTGNSIHPSFVFPQKQTQNNNYI